MSIRHTRQIIWVFVSLLQGLDDDGRSTAATIADASATNLALLLLEHTKKSSCDPGAGSTKCVTESDSTSVKVDLILCDTKDLHVGQRNNTEGLVDLEGVDGGEVHLGVLQSLGHGQGRSSGELGGVLLSITPAKNLANGLKTVLLDSLFRGENNGSGAIGKWRGVGSSNGTVLLERRTERAGLCLVELWLVSN